MITGKAKRPPPPDRIGREQIEVWYKVLEKNLDYQCIQLRVCPLRASGTGGSGGGGGV
jgi:hypothetical protein